MIRRQQPVLAYEPDLHGPWLWELLPARTRERIRVLGLAHRTFGEGAATQRPDHMIRGLREIVAAEEALAHHLLLEREEAP